MNVMKGLDNSEQITEIKMTKIINQILLYQKIILLVFILSKNSMKIYE